MKKPVRIHRRMAGVSMVEALVALVIISVGMLGIAGMYLSSLQAGRSANLRMQALNLTSDLADRIRANRGGLVNYEVAATGTGEEHECETETCTAAEVAENDLFLWKQAISEPCLRTPMAGWISPTTPHRRRIATRSSSPGANRIPTSTTPTP